MSSIVKKLIAIALGVLLEYVAKYGKPAIDYIFDQIEKFVLRSDMDDETKDLLMKLMTIIRDVVSVPDDDEDQANPV